MSINDSFSGLLIKEEHVCSTVGLICCPGCRQKLQLLMMSQDILLRDRCTSSLVHCGKSHSRQKHDEEHMMMRRIIFTSIRRVVPISERRRFARTGRGRYVNASRVGFQTEKISTFVRTCVCAQTSILSINRKTELLLEKGLFEFTFVLAGAGCNTQNTTRHKHVIGKVKLTSEVTNRSKMHLKHPWT